MSINKDKAIQILGKAKRQYKDEIDQQVESREVLSFLLGSELYSFETKSVREIIKPQIIYKVPTTPGYLLGVMNLRGEIFGVVNLKKFLDISEVSDEENQRIVVASERITMGFVVDFVIDILNIPGSQIQPPLSTIEKKKVDYFEGEVVMEDNKLLSIINLEKLLNSEEIRNPSGK
ncbi:chemotaxis protein CheW [Elusimicrobiota bacterium]